jgi:NADH-quinone oxidoreductase subunit J
LAHNLFLFYTFAGLAVVSALLVIAQSNPIYSVLLLIVSFGALAGLYVLLDAPFVAVTQIVVYAGAIMVLFLFVVMLLNSPREEVLPQGEAVESGSTRVIGVLLAIMLIAELLWAFDRSRAFAGGRVERETPWTVTEIGQVLFREYAFAFEATSILILVAMVGAIALAGRYLAEPNTNTPRIPTRGRLPTPESQIPTAKPQIPTRSSEWPS